MLTSVLKPRVLSTADSNDNLGSSTPYKLAKVFKEAHVTIGLKSICLKFKLVCKA